MAVFGRECNHPLSQLFSHLWLGRIMSPLVQSGLHLADTNQSNPLVHQVYLSTSSWHRLHGDLLPLFGVVHLSIDQRVTLQSGRAIRQRDFCPCISQSCESVLILYRFRDQCQVWQPPDGVHCPECNVCVAGYNHHCVWMGTCIGKKNY